MKFTGAVILALAVLAFMLQLNPASARRHCRFDKAFLTKPYAMLFLRFNEKEVVWVEEELVAIVNLPGGGRIRIVYGACEHISQDIYFKFRINEKEPDADFWIEKAKWLARKTQYKVQAAGLLRVLALKQVRSELKKLARGKRVDFETYKLDKELAKEGVDAPEVIFDWLDANWGQVIMGGDTFNSHFKVLRQMRSKKR